MAHGDVVQVTGEVIEVGGQRKDQTIELFFGHDLIGPFQVHERAVAQQLNTAGVGAPQRVLPAPHRRRRWALPALLWQRRLRIAGLLDV